MIIGLDASSNIIGWTVINDDGSVLSAGIIDLSKEKDLLAKYDIMFNELTKIRDSIQYDNVEICIEDFLKRFISGASSASTIIKLAQANILCQLAVKRVFHTIPTLINVSSARRNVIGKIPKETKNKKEYVWQWFLNNHKDLLFILPTKTNKKTGEISYLKKGYDIVDSFIVASYRYQTSKSA